MMLSIITVNLNNADGLRKTIESVVSQTFTDYEYIIIDGASTDGSIDVIKQYADKITYWVSESDKGIYNAMNIGILRAKGEYLQFLNSGDTLCSPTVLYSVFAMNINKDFIYGDIATIDNSEIIKTIHYPSNLDTLFFIHGMVSHQSIFHKRILFLDNLYSEDYKIAADWEFFLKMIVFKNASYAKVDVIVSYVELGGISSNIDLMKLERRCILEKYFPKIVLMDLAQYYDQKHYSLYPYLSIFAKYPKLQRTVKRFMKILLFLSGKKNLIPR
jgi:Glycosyltransferases involved in cell wall biogenesis